jgi:hypothetical protein
MRKSFGLAVVGFVLTFGIASRFASQARVNQPLSVTSTLAKQPILANPNLLKVTAFPGEDFLVNKATIDHNPAIQFDQTGVRVQNSEFASQQSFSSPPIHPWEGNPESTSLTSPVFGFIPGYNPKSEIQNPKSPHSIVSSQLEKNLLTGGLYAQTPIQEIPETEDGERFRRVMDYARTNKAYQRPMGEIIQAIAQQFLGAAYKADLLDQSKEETLVVTLNKFDCVLFVETVLAIARGVAVQDYSYPTFVNHIRDQRYWNGQMNGYCSRLHYFSEWIFDNQQRGTVQNIGQKLGGVPLNKKLNFMTTHRQSYRPMAKDDTTYQCRVEREAQLNGVTVDYIPTNKIRRVYSQLQPGDIIAVATNIPGLDVTHTGLVYRQPNGNIGFIHASPAGQVTIARDLERYISRVDNAIGILVTRPIDPRQTTL